MPQVNRYLAGELILIPLTVTITATGALVDPTELGLALMVRVLEGGSYELRSIYYVYGDDDTIVRDGIGQYHADIDSTEFLGDLVYVWKSTGAGQGMTQGQCYVDVPVVVPEV